MDKQKYYSYAKLRWPNLRTQAAYRWQARRLEEYWQGDPPKLTQESINLYLASISRNRSYGNPLYYGFLRGYIECYREELESEGVSLKIIKPTSRRETNKQYKFLEIDDVNYLIANIQDLRMRLTMIMMFDTGLRVSELQRLYLSNIDFGERTVSGKGKGGKPFKVKFGPDTRELLIQWVEQAPNRDRPFLFYTRGAHPHPWRDQAAACYYFMKRAAEKIGYPDVHPHRFRHALGYFLRKHVRLDLVEIKTKLRHSDISTTQIYAPATQEEVDRKIDKLVFKVNDGKSQ